MKKELDDLKEAFGALEKQYKEDKAAVEDPKITQIYDTVYAMVSNLSRRLDYISDSHWNYQSSHAKGHPPALNTASALENYLKACGMQNDYTVQKPSLYVASASSKGKTYTLDYKKN